VAATNTYGAIRAKTAALTVLSATQAQISVKSVPLTQNFKPMELVSARKDFSLKLVFVKAAITLAKPAKMRVFARPANQDF
jgi:hypothetical protein